VFEGSDLGRVFKREFLGSSRYHGVRGFLFHLLRIRDLAAGRIQNHDQIIIAIILKPAMLDRTNVLTTPPLPPGRQLRTACI